MAAAQLLPVESATGDDVSIYQLKWVEWGGDFSPIVVQVCMFHSTCCTCVLGGAVSCTILHAVTCRVQHMSNSTLIGGAVCNVTKTGKVSSYYKPCCLCTCVHTVHPV